MGYKYVLLKSFTQGHLKWSPIRPGLTCQVKWYCLLTDWIRRVYRQRQSFGCTSMFICCHTLWFLNYPTIWHAIPGPSILYVPHYLAKYRFRFQRVSQSVLCLYQRIPTTTIVCINTICCSWIHFGAFNLQNIHF